MPKHNRRRKGKHGRDTPTGLESGADLKGLVDTPSSRDASLPVLKKLKSVADHERELGCQILASLVFEDDGAFDKLVKGGVLPVLTERLCDKAVPVRGAAAGAAQNMIMAGGEECCQALVELSCFTPLLQNLQHSVVDGEDGEAAAARALMQSHTLGLLVLLCEGVEGATAATTKAGFAVLALPLLASSALAGALAINAARFLYTVSQENDAVQAQLQAHTGLLEALSSITQDTAASPHLRAYVGGVLYNVYGGVNPAHVEAVLGLVDTLLSFEPLAAAAEVAAVSGPDAKESVREWKACVHAQQVGLELLAMLASDLMEVEVEEDPHTALIVDLLRKGSFARVFAKVLRAGQCLAETLKGSLSPSLPPVVLTLPQTLDKTPLLAAACVANLLLTFEVAPLAVPAELWQWQCHMCACALSSGNTELLSLMTGGMWTLLRKVQAEGGDLAIVSSEHVRSFMLNLSTAAFPPEVRVNAIGMIAAVGAACTEAALVQDMVTALLLPLQEDPAHLMLVLEALNAIMDVFADAHAEVFAAGGVGEVVLAYCPQLAALEADTEALDAELADRLSETAENLQRFIAYKQGR